MNNWADVGRIADKKYKRLTEETKDCFRYDLKDFKHKVGEFNDYDAFFAYSMAVKRLGELEEKIEDGTLVERPPVKVGDRIWIIRKYWDYFGGKTKKEVVGRFVKRIFLNNDNSLTFSCLVIHKGIKLISIVKSTTFNKTWFLTKAEAEARLKELQEGRE